MTSEQRSLFYKGRDYWQEYVNLNGYSFRPTEDGLRLLAKKSGEKTSVLRRCINMFLEA